jgi:Zn-dependent protease with chaperone function
MDAVTLESIPAPLAPLFSSPQRMAARPVSFFYKLGLGLVTLAMVLLPCVYIALTALAGYGVYYFATHYFADVWTWHIPGRFGPLVKVVCSCTPLLVGTIVVFFMVKPIFARRANQMQPITLNPDHEPVFHALVHRICEIVGAPAPREIRLNCEVNASAGFRRGFRSFFGNDLVLTVGLPLLAGLSMREISGVIAHEFGHFTQGAAMRLSYIIRRVNFWFARVIYQRDSWDATLDDWAESEDGWVAFMVGCARPGVWFSRLILKGLMLVGHAITGFLMREMEYDADRCEIHVAGSEGFEWAMFHLAEAGATTNWLHHEMAKTWRASHRLPDNIPMLVAHHVAQMSDDARAKVAAGVCTGKSGWLDTHPSHGDRIAAARRIGAPGLFTEDAHAIDLLQNFYTLGKFVTLAHYEDDLEIPTTDDFLIPVEAVLNQPEPAESAPEPAPIAQAPRWQGPPTS